jgi:hypothetical protein
LYPFRLSLPAAPLSLHFAVVSHHAKSTLAKVSSVVNVDLLSWLWRFAMLVLRLLLTVVAVAVVVLPFVMHTGRRNNVVIHALVCDKGDLECHILTQEANT